MSWIAWLIAAAALFLVGACLLRAGRAKVVGLYAALCAVTFLLWITDFAALLGSEFAWWNRFVMTALAPGTVILALWHVERDRAAVMGRPEERDMIATAAVVYGASELHGSDGGGDPGVGGE